MEDNQDFDRHFREGIEDFQIKPPQRSWDVVNGELMRKQVEFQQKKTNRFKRLSAALALLLLLFICIQYLTPDNNFNSSREKNSKKINSEKTVSSISKKINEPNSSIAINNSNTKESIKQKNLNKFYPSKTNSSPVIIHHKKQIVALTLKSKNKKLKSAHGIFEMQNENQENTSSLSSLLHDNEPDSTIYSRQHHSEKNNSLEVNIPESVQTENLIVNPLDKIQDIKNDDPGQHTRDSTYIVDTHTKSHWSVAVFYSPSYSKNHLKENQNVTHNEEVEYYKNERTNYSHATGIAIGFDLKQQWTLLSGISYSTISYTIAVPKIYARHGFDNELHYQYPTSCGIIQVSDIGVSALNEGDSLVTNISCRQKLQFINIPLTIRYKIAGNHFTCFADAGFAFNFVINERAKLQTGNTEKTITNNIDGLKKLNYGYHAGIGLQYNLHNDFGIYIEPVFKGSVNSLTEKIPENCYPYSFGLNMGLTYHF